MATPTPSFTWARVLDPSDIADFLLDLNQLIDVANGEDLASYTLTLAPEAVALGLSVGTGEYATTELTPNVFRIYFTIDPAFQSNPAFDKLITLPMTLTVVTTAAPPRQWQRTLGVQVKQQ